MWEAMMGQSQGEQVGARQSLLRQILGFVKRNPAIGLSVVYAYFAFLGSVYQWVLFSRFDLNYFAFAEVNDFLTAAFVQPLVVIGSVFALLCAVWLARLVLGRSDSSLSGCRFGGVERIQFGLLVLRAHAPPGILPFSLHRN